MNETLGKRIAQHRRRLKLTQDQLAEQLGITAQAISKWENDQSCPDITMLPKLAEIFGVSTDELLGHTTAPVHQAEVVEDEEDTGIHFSGSSGSTGNWEFHWDEGRSGALFFALLVLMVGVLTLLSKILSWDVSFWSILWPCALLLFGVRGLTKKFSFFSIGCTLFGGYFLIENLGIWELNIAGELIFPIIIVLFGISLFVDALRKPKKPVFQITRDGKSAGSNQPQKHYTIDGETFDCSMTFGDNSQLVTLHCLSEGEISCSFGNFAVDLSGCDTLADRCTIEANCSFGELRLFVPSRFQVVSDSNTAFASIDTVGHPSPTPEGIIQLEANVSFGQITIEYV